MSDSWKVSKTNLTLKKTKLSAKDLQPIALLNQSYKIFMGCIQSKIEDHLCTNHIVNELQSAFTKQIRTIDNVFILKHCIQESYSKNTPLYIQ